MVAWEKAGDIHTCLKLRDPTAGPCTWERILVLHRSCQLSPCAPVRYVRDLPAGVIRMNDECLKLRDHTAGYQTVEDIQAVVGEAIGLHKKPMADDDYIDEAMVLPSTLLSYLHHGNGFRVSRGFFRVVLCSSPVCWPVNYSVCLAPESAA